MSAALTRHEASDEAIELALVEGDLSRLTSAQRRHYYLQVCQSVGLNPLTKPFDYLRLNGKIVLYAKKDCTDQLRGIKGISVTLPQVQIANGLCTVTARAMTKDGREDTDVGVVNVENLRGEALANAVMKAHTKAKRRVTLSIAGLGFIDESEVDDIKGAERVTVDAPTRPPSTPPPALPAAEARLASVLRGVIEGAATVAELQTTWKRVNDAHKAGKVSLEERAQLQDAKDARKKAMQAPPPVDVSEALAGNEMPPEYGGPDPDAQDPREPCFYCKRPVGPKGVQFEGPDGEIVQKHDGCNAFMREPGEDDR